jgi:hypothetical protein
VLLCFLNRMIRAVEPLVLIFTFLAVLAPSFTLVALFPRAPRALDPGKRARLLGRAEA